MDVIETLTKVVLVWTMLSVATAVVWARFMGHVARLEAAVTHDRTVRLSTVAAQFQPDAAHWSSDASLRRAA